MEIQTRLRSVYQARRISSESLLLLIVGVLSILIGPSVFNVYGESNSLAGKVYHSQFAMLRFESRNDLVFSGIDPDRGEQFHRSYRYQFSEENGVPFIEIDGSEEGHWLILACDEFLLAYKDAMAFPFFVGVSQDSGGIEALTLLDVESVSSYLVEGSVAYTGANLRNTRLSMPWVENVPGPGIGEEIVISPVYSQRIWISNGFVSFEKPYLYRANARAKRIEVRDITNESRYEVELRDTPSPQAIELRQETERVILTIVDVYEGERWDDMAINFLLRY